jgi:DNA repair photolyase
VYCYGPLAAHKKKDDYHRGISLRKNALAKLAKDAALLSCKQDDREILLSFLSDPYTPEDQTTQLTRQALQILVNHDLRFTPLTKGGTRATRDFDLLADHNKARFGTSLVFWNQTEASEWEPNAATIKDRIKAIERAHDLHIPTWVSLEPVVFPEQAIRLVKELNPIVTHWKVGKLNYAKPPTPVDWLYFREEIKALFESLGADYFFKKSLSDL